MGARSPATVAHIARFVAYIEANTVRERLDAVVPGEWDLTLELLPPVAGLDEDANRARATSRRSSRSSA
jgi:hypothetical protein